MNRVANSLVTSLAIQNARTRIFVPGSDPRFSPRAGNSGRSRFSTSTPAREAPVPTPRLFAPGLLDRLHAPLTRYSE